MYLEESPYQRDQLISIEQLIGRALDHNIDLGQNHQQTIENYVNSGLIPRLLNGQFPATALDRLIFIDKMQKDGKSIDEIKDFISKERRKFLEKPMDLASLVEAYQKASKSLLMLGLVGVVVFFLGTIFVNLPDSGVKRSVTKPVGKVLAAFIKDAKSGEPGSTDPLGLTNIDQIIQVNDDDELVIEKAIAQTSSNSQTSLNLNADKIDGADAGIEAGNVLLLDDLGDINFVGNVKTTGQFIGDGSFLTNLNLDLHTIETVSLLGIGNLDFVAGSGISITANDTDKTISFSLTSQPSTYSDTFDSLDSSQFLRSDTSDNFTSGTLTLNSGTTLSVNGAASFAGIQINNPNASSSLTITNSNASATGLTILSGANDGSFNTGIRVGGAESNGEDIATGYLYKINGLNLFGFFTFSATGTDAYLAEIACTTCTSATSTLTNGFHLKASGSGTTVTNGLHIEALSSGVITTGINLNGSGIVTDISLQNGETISNNTDGIIALTGDFDASGHGAFGASASVSSFYLLNIYETISAVSSPGGISSQLVVTNNSNTQFINGFGQYTTYSGSGTNQTLTGLASYVSQTSGSATFLYGADISATTGGTTSSAGTVVGLKVIASSSVATASYGIWIEDITASTATEIPIFQSGTSGYNLYYAGSNMFGRSPSGEDLDYRVVIQGSLCVDDSTPNCPNAPTSGAIYVENSVGTGNVSAFDISEYYPASEEVEKGDVVMADPSAVATVKRSTSIYQKGLVGIVATDPAIVINENEITFGKTAGDNFNSRKPYIALAGRVPVKVSNENGDIEVGDYLTSSSLPGVAMKATSTGPTIGKALESYSVSGISKIMVFVDNSFYVNLDESPTQTLTSNFYLNKFINSSGDAIFSKVTAVFANFQKLVFGELVVEKDANTAGLSKINDGVDEVFIEAEKVSSDSLINLTPSSNPPGILYVKEKIEGSGFVVGIKRIDGNNSAIDFSWFILNQE